MKLSMKIRDEAQQKPPLINAKIPITVFTLPFISGFVAGDSSDLSFNLTTYFPSCPSLRLSYSPTSATSPPFSVSIKSGVGAFGSPRDSPLVISADLNLFSDRNPSFMLQIKPRLGHFSVLKTASSNSNPRSGQLPKSGSGAYSDLMGWSNIDMESGGRGDKSLGLGREKLVRWQDLESLGFEVLARSDLPVTSKLLVNISWGVNFPADVRKQLPFLTLDKIGIQRVEVVKEVKKVDDGVGEVENLSVMYSWLGKDFEELQRENKELRQGLEEFKASCVVRNYSSDFEAKKSLNPNPIMGRMSYSDSRSKRNGVDEIVVRDMKKHDNKGSSLEDELQKAIKAASAS